MRCSPEARSDFVPLCPVDPGGQGAQPVKRREHGHNVIVVSSRRQEKYEGVGPKRCVPLWRVAYRRAGKQRLGHNRGRGTVQVNP